MRMGRMVTIRWNMRERTGRTDMHDENNLKPSMGGFLIAMFVVVMMIICGGGQ